MPTTGEPTSAGAPTPVTLTVNEGIAAVIVDSGVTDVFGLMGDDTCRLVSALVERGVDYHGARHENAAIAMAAGYSAASGHLGVCVISRGPGTTNGVTAAVNASNGDGSVLIITGEMAVSRPANTLRLPDSKAFDAEALASACGLAKYTPRSADVVWSTTQEAVAGASRGQTVLLTIPQDVFEAKLTPSAEARAPEQFAAEGAPARPEAIAAAAAVLGGRRRILIVAGAGAWHSGARDAIVELADRVGAVLATTLRGKDMFRGHPYNLGIVGSFSHSAGRRVMEEADCVLVFGASLNRYTTNDGTSLPAAPVVHVDARRDNIGRFHWADVAVVGDARLVARQLHDALPERSGPDAPLRSEETRVRLEQFSLWDDFEPARTEHTLDPRTVLLHLDQLLPENRAIVTDNGNFFGFVPPHVSVPTPDRFKLSSDFAVIGLGLGTALGTVVGRPEAQTVLIIGDGGLLMSLGELESVARLDLPLIIVVMNDCAYGAERHFLELRNFSGRTAMSPDADFASMAQAFGIEALTVRTVEQLQALAPLLSDRQDPLLIDCKITPTVVAPFLSELGQGR